MEDPSGDLKLSIALRVQYSAKRMEVLLVGNGDEGRCY